MPISYGKTVPKSVSTSLSLCCVLFASTFCRAAPPDSTFKDWYFTPTGVYGRSPIADVRHRNYLKIIRQGPDVVFVQKFNPVGRLVDIHQIKFTAGSISLITETDEWGETFDSIWFKPEDKDDFILREKHNGQNPYLPCKAARFTFKNDLLREILCLVDSTRPGTNQEGVSHYVFERYDDPQRFGLVKSETYFNEIDMPVYSRKEGCHQLTYEYDKKGNVTSRSAYDEKDRPMTDQNGAFRTTYKYDGDDNETEEDYFDVNGSPVITRLGFAKIGREYKKGLPESETYYDFNYNAVISGSLADSVAKTLYQYDKEGHVTGKSFFYPDGGRMMDKSGINRILYEYSSAGMLTAVTEYGLKGVNQEEERELTRFRFGRDEKGRVTSLISFNSLVRPSVIIGNGTLLTKYGYNNWGRVCSTSYWLEDSLKTRCLEGYHESRVRYDEDGQISEYDYYDETGKLTPHGRGFSRILLTYNEQGLVADNRYFDDERPVSVDNPLSSSTSFHQVKFGYDLLNRLRTIAYFDISGRPVNAMLRNVEGKTFRDQRMDITYAGERVIGQELHDSGNVSSPVLLDCASKQCIPVPGYMPSTVVRAAPVALRSYHGRIKIDSLYGDQITFIDRDSILLFMSAGVAELSSIACAERYRIVRINKYYQEDGLAIDRYLENDSIAARLSYTDGELNGPCVFYYINGAIQEKGVYRKNARAGIWDYYYDNGQLAKTIDFSGKMPLLVQCYSADGKPLAQQGNGRFEGSILTGTVARNRIRYTMTGTVRNGLPDGEWKLFSRFISGPADIEYFSAGVFQHGVSFSYTGKREYRQDPVGRFESVHPEEAPDYYGQNNTCNVKGVHKEYDYGEDWFTVINKGFGEIMRTGQFNNYSGWVFLDLKFDEDGRITNQFVRLYQPNDGFRMAILNMMDRLEHHADVFLNNKKTSYEKFFIVLVDSGQVVIPEQLLTQQRMMLK